MLAAACRPDPIPAAGKARSACHRKKALRHRLNIQTLLQTVNACRHALSQECMQVEPSPDVPQSLQDCMQVYNLLRDVPQSLQGCMHAEVASYQPVRSAIGPQGVGVRGVSKGSNATKDRASQAQQVCHRPVRIPKEVGRKHRPAQNLQWPPNLKMKRLTAHAHAYPKDSKVECANSTCDASSLAAFAHGSCLHNSSFKAKISNARHLHTRIHLRGCQGQLVRGDKGENHLVTASATVPVLAAARELLGGLVRSAALSLGRMRGSSGLGG